MSRRQDIQDATGRVEYLAGRGTLQAWGPGAHTNGVGTPDNGVVGFAPGALWQDTVNGHTYVNLGTFASSNWFVNDASSLEQIVFGGGTNPSTTAATMLGSGNVYRTVSAVGLNPAVIGGDRVVAVYSLPANSLDASGRGLTITCGGNKANNGATVEAKIIIGCTTAVVGSLVTGGTTIADLGAITTSGGIGWVLQAQVWKTGAANSNTQIAQATGIISGTTHGGVSTNAALAMTENAAILIACTLNATTTATDISLWWMEVAGTN